MMGTATAAVASRSVRFDAVIAAAQIAMRVMVAPGPWAASV